MERVNKMLQDRLVKETSTCQHSLNRTVSHSPAVQYDRAVYLLEPTEFAKDLQRKKVRVVDYPDGTVAIKYQGTEPPYSVFNKVRQVQRLFGRSESITPAVHLSNCSIATQSTS